MFRWGVRTYVMGIVNCSPDSFAGDGHIAARAAVDHALRLVDEGADVLDIGGESTRPGAAPVTLAEEQRRVLPVIEALKGRVTVPLSVDTSKAGVAAAALDTGATMVNDVRALLADPALAEVVAARGAWVALMDNRLDPVRTGDRTPGYAPRLPPGKDVVAGVGTWLSRRVTAAGNAGIARDRIVIDPGLGFGKTAAQSFALLRRLGELRQHPRLAGIPVLVGPSRKGFIGSVQDLPVAERLEGTLAALALAIAGGADLVRVHDVRAAVRCCRVADAIVRGPL